MKPIIDVHLLIPARAGRRVSIRVASCCAALASCAAAFAQLTVLHDFDQTPDGRSPRGVSARAGAYLFGVAQYGGANSWGSVWAYQTTTGTFAKLHDFSRAADGGVPIDLVVAGNAILGTTSGGGAHDDGTIWQIFPGPFDNRRDLDGAVEGASGRGIVLKDGHIYAVTYAGGGSGAGTIFSMNTTTGDFDTLHEFDAAADGLHPSGRPVFRGNVLYGTAFEGGANGSGTLWSLDITSNQFTKLHDFDALNDGNHPAGDVVLDGAVLYGSAMNGGANNQGTLWSYDPAQRGVAKLHDFAQNVDGSGPGAMRQYGGRLIGTAANGGSFADGTIWQYDILSGEFETLRNLWGNVDGSFPAGHLLLDGSVLYGGSFFGGAHGGGTLWSFQIPGCPPSDLDADGDIDVQDLAFLLASFGTAGGAAWMDGNLDGDGDVDLQDLAILLASFGAQCE